MWLAMSMSLSFLCPPIPPNHCLPTPPERQGTQESKIFRVERTKVDRLDIDLFFSFHPLVRHVCLSPSYVFDSLQFLVHTKSDKSTHLPKVHCSEGVGLGVNPKLVNAGPGLSLLALSTHFKGVLNRDLW